MSKDARNQDLDLSPEVREQFDRLVAVLAKHGFGEDGPPRETTFAQIEQFGHQAGRMVARAIDAALTQQHASHFTEPEPCPACDEKCPSKESPHDLPLQTEDGDCRVEAASGGRRFSARGLRQDRPPRDLRPGDRLPGKQHAADELPGLSSSGPADDVCAHGVVGQRDQRSGERHGKILQRRRQWRSDSTGPRRRVV